MAVAPVNIYRATLPGTSGTLNTVPTGKTWVVTDILIVNPTGSTQTATITVDGVVLVPAVPVGAGGQYQWQGKQVVAATKVIAGFAASTSVAAHINGSEVS